MVSLVPLELADILMVLEDTACRDYVIYVIPPHVLVRFLALIQWRKGGTNTSGQSVTLIFSIFANVIVGLGYLKGLVLGKCKLHFFLTLSHRPLRASWTAQTPSLDPKYRPFSSNTCSKRTISRYLNKTVRIVGAYAQSLEYKKTSSNPMSIRIGGDITSQCFKANFNRSQPF